MALTQQFARVSPEYLERCARSAAHSPTDDPGWDPPASDTLDLNWSLWQLAHYLRWSGAHTALLGTLERGYCGDGAEPVRFLDHRTVHDGFDAPPSLLAPAAVSEVSHLLDAVDVDEMLRLLPSDPEQAAEVCRFGRFHGDLHAYLARNFLALRDFYREASRRSLAVVVWID